MAILLNQLPSYLPVMAGIYIHIPFCKQACSYCNFHFSTNKKLLPQLINAIVAETSLQKKYTNEIIDTIYFGGGTPSIILPSYIEQIIDAIKNNFTVNINAEITLEANPDDITEDNLLAWKKIGINRFSLGIQSFDEEELQWFNRSHNAEQAKFSIELIKKYFSNYSIDLIFGSPKLSNEKWLQNIETALTFNPPHLSCYALTVEEKTKLGYNVNKKLQPNIDDKKQAEQFEILMKVLHSKGYTHYEISNYAKPNFESKHNSSYWQGKHYIGLGPSAHSFNGNSRSWNIANNALYIQSIANNILPQEIEILTPQQQFNEYVMIGVRTITGIDLHRIEQKFGKEYLLHIQTKMDNLLQQNFIAFNHNTITLTNTGKLYADAIAVELFL